MTDSIPELHLQGLRGQFAALQAVCRKDPEGLNGLLSAAIEALQRSVKELQGFRETSAQNERADATHGPRAEDLLAVQYAITQVLSEAKSLEEACPLILASMCEHLSWEVGELWSIDAKTRVPRCVHIWPTPPVTTSEPFEGQRSRPYPSAPGLPRDLWENGAPVWIADVEPGKISGTRSADRAGPNVALYLPISEYGETCAIIQVSTCRAREKQEAEVEFMAALASQIGQFVERKRCEERILKSETWKTAMLEASLDAVITIDATGRVVEFNSAAETIFSYRRVEAIGRHLVDLIVPPRLRERALINFGRYQATSQSGLIGRRVDSFAMKSDGSEFPVEIAVTRVAVETPPMLTVYVRDATARKSAQEDVTLYQRRMRALTAELLVAEERERRRLSIDLHDGLSQTIALARIKLGLLRRSTDAALSKSLDEIDRLIDQANQSARSLTFELSPPVLHDLGLEPAVQWLVENIQARYGIETVFEDDGQLKPADESTRVILFRSIRELLINAAKHASAHRVLVRLMREENRLNAEVEDDGVGMEETTLTARGSGLFSIRERLEHVGGNMSIESVRGRGTKVRLHAPLSSQATA